MRLTVLGKSPSWQDANGACSGYLLEQDGIAVLIDCGSGVFGRLQSYVEPGIVRAVIISHMHADHVHLGSLRAVGAGTAVLAPNGAGDWLRRHGLRDVRELGQETAEIGPLSAASVSKNREFTTRSQNVFGEKYSAETLASLGISTPTPKAKKKTRQKK